MAKTDCLEQSYDALTAEPEPNIDNFLNSFYFRRSLAELNELLTSLAIKTEPVRILFSGHTGSGKTSELHYLATQLEKDEKFLVIYIRSQKELFKGDIESNDILLLSIKKLLDLIVKLELKLDQKLIDDLDELLALLGCEVTKETIRDTSHGYKFAARLVVFGAKLKDTYDTRTVLRKTTSGLLTDILKISNIIIDEVQRQLKKKILIIVDDLEKITTIQQIRNLYDGMTIIINGLNSYFLLTLPLRIIFSPERRQIGINYCRTMMLPLFEVKHSDGRMNELEIQDMYTIAKKRIAGKCIPDDVIHTAAIFSGGIVDDFLKLLEYSCLKSLTNNRNSVTNVDMQMSINTLASEYISGLSSSNIDTLKDIHKTKAIQLDDTIKELMVTGVVLQYTCKDNSDVWYDVHPVVSQVLRLG